MAKDDIQGQRIWRLLRCKKTHRYFTGEAWADDVNEAKAFGDQVDAVRACVQHNLTDIELVLRVEGSECDLFTTSLR